MEVSPVGKNSSFSSLCHSPCSAARGLNLMSLLTLKRRSPSASGGRAARYSGCWKRAASGPSAARRPLRRLPRLRGEVGGRLGAEVLQDPQRVFAGPARGGAGRRGGRRAGAARAALGPAALQARQQVDHDVHGAGDEEHHEDQHPELADQEHFHGRERLMN